MVIVYSCSVYSIVKVEAEENIRPYLKRGEIGLRDDGRQRHLGYICCWLCVYVYGVVLRVISVNIHYRVCAREFS